jgi:hypothetical protein
VFLIGKGAIELVPPGQEGQDFYTTFFIVPKKDGVLRPILNLKPLNVYMEKSHFKMETQIHKNVNLLTAEMPTYCGH